MHARREYDEYELITVGFKAQAHQVQIVHDAAAAKGVSTTAYLKGLVLEWAASDLGLPPSAVADRVRGGRKNGADPNTAPTHTDAAVAVARLEQTIADAMTALESLRGARRRSNPPPPARAVSGERRVPGRR
jgi:hypothetical protein